ncbi:5'-nucleotidase, lipoprotein e(P4) family [Ancylomarina euxinus]|uniref:5'-nucleotidase, lipoprotein e(P4) family n=1 Tax=Ancylomarina euxinus TaxID=2283627 RepID=A0A425Y896_9BACT|nr:5'-nucleotidase, lipoprotein e(P4) family [Ancylomarina euxinus]MCZ4693425.1 5'-nucleotidase, lipoprotein e(P4) family [Ancylomarina euxinus]MUP13652.1 5'-nucleotidase, lipoprotein e(P4) family [Ancylomarina euxinus]RRG24706.1 5'-nucleotidase, lipoprotein e(P4) family [Ancylomarina euxinus]
MKKQIYSVLVFALILGACTNSNTAVKPETNKQNDYLTMSTLWYQRASECRALYYQAFNFAKHSLVVNLAESKNDKPQAVVVDIDETVLDNSPFEAYSVRTGKSYSEELWHEWTDKAGAQATPGSLEFLKFAESKGVETFYISNRSVSETAVTLQNLKALGFPFADEAHMLLKTDTSIKTVRRNKVSETHEILILAGDNIGDFDELFEDRNQNFGFETVDAHRADFGKRFIILPNPMYGSWERVAFKGQRGLNPEQKNELRKEALLGYKELGN